MHAQVVSRITPLLTDRDRHLAYLPTTATKRRAVSPLRLTSVLVRTNVDHDPRLTPGP